MSARDRGACRVWWAPVVGGPAPDAATRARCARMRHPADRARHLSGQLLARAALAAWAGPTATLHCAPHRRPRVEGAPLWLSIAHAADHVAVAVASCPVGIDFEPREGADGAHRGALEGLSPAEKRRLAALPPTLRPEAALARWVAREALLKATGHGLAIDPAGVELEPIPGGWRILHAPEPIGHTRAWSLRRPAAPAGLCAALALADPALHPTHHHTAHPGRVVPLSPPR